MPTSMQLINKQFEFFLNYFIPADAMHVYSVQVLKVEIAGDGVDYNNCCKKTESSFETTVKQSC